MVVEPARRSVSSFFYSVSIETNSNCGFQVAFQNWSRPACFYIWLMFLRIRDDISNISTHIQIRRPKVQISEILAIAAMTLLLIHIADGSMERFGKHGFLPVNIDKKPFRISNFGISSIILFFLAFGMDIRGKNTSKVTTSLIIVGGALIGITALGVAVMDRTVATLLTVFVMGYVIMGLGILRAIQQRKYTSKIV